MLFDEFLMELRDILQTEATLEMSTRLGELEEWDSLSQMAVMAWFDRRLGKKVAFNLIQNCSTVLELAKLAEGDITL